MFSKLLKYDYRAMKKFGKPMFFIVLGLIGAGMLNSVLMGMSIARLEILPGFSEHEIALNGFFLTMSAVLMFMIMIALSMAAFAILILTLVHFYKTMTTDEGYLTFTLPVRSTDILNAKLINASAWLAVFVLLCVLGVLLIVGTLSLSIAAFGKEGWAAAGRHMVNMLESVFSANWIAILQIFIMSLATIVNTVLLYDMVIFFSSVVSKKNRVITAVACIIGTYFAYGTVSGIIMLIVSVFGAVIYSGQALLSYTDLTMIIYFVLLAGSSVLFYFATKHMMEKKLNLP